MHQHRSPQKRFILFLALIFSIQLGYSQVGGCDWEIEVSAEPLPVKSTCATEPASNSPCTDGGNCDKLYYYVYIAKVGSQNDFSTEHIINFSQLSFTSDLTVTATGSATGTNKKFSKFDEAASIACTPLLGGPGTSNYTLEASDDQFTFFYFGINNEVTSLSVYGRKLLCVIAVDPFMGEGVNLSSISSFVKLASNQTCSLPVLTTPNIPIPINCTLNAQSLDKGVTTPTACALGAAPRLRIGSPVDDPTSMYPNRKKVPIYMTSGDLTPTLYNFSRMEFLMKVTSMQLMAQMGVEAGNVPVSDLDFYNEIPPNSTSDRRLYVNSENLSITTSSNNAPTNDNTLFYIYVNGPQLSSDCATATVSFTDYRRIFDNCCQPMISGSQDIVWGQAPNCPIYCPNYAFDVSKAEDPDPIEYDLCEDLMFDVGLTKPQSVITYDNMRVVLDVHHTGTLAFEQSISESIFAFCTPINTCITSSIPGSGVIRVDINIPGPFSLSNDAYFNIARIGFKGEAACITSVEFVDAYVTEQGAIAACLPSFSSDMTDDDPEDDLCSYSLKMAFVTHSGTHVEEVAYTIDSPDCAIMFGFALTSPHSDCACTDLDNGEIQVLTPFKDDNYLAGVSTYDLVLISKHVLGLETFTEPHQLLAADGNNSLSITTFDIVEIRKLILGIYAPPTYPNYLPNNTSFRFYNQMWINSLQIPTTFLAMGTPSETFSFSSPPTNVKADFLAVKVGDVNDSYSNLITATNDRIEPDVKFGYSSSSKEGRKSIPIFSLLPFSASSWQVSIHYNRSKFGLENIKEGIHIQQGSLEFAWHEPKPGEVRITYFNPEGNEVQYEPGEPLFYLEFEDGAMPELEIHTQSELESVIFDSNGRLSRIQLTRASSELLVEPDVKTSTSQPVHYLQIYPNPASDQFRIQISAPESAEGKVEIRTMDGELVYEEVIQLQQGENMLTSANMPKLPSGTYIVRLIASFGEESELLIKTDRN